MRKIVLLMLCIAAAPVHGQLDIEPKLGKKTGKVSLVDMVGQIIDASGHLGELRAELENLIFADGVHDASLQSVVTKTGQPVELAAIYMPSLSHPGSDYSLVVLLVKGQVIDWAACRVYDRQGRCELMLEDVDKDGFADLAFRLKWAWGKNDPRKKMLK